jgi:hypothetical protein
MIDHGALTLDEVLELAKEMFPTMREADCGGYEYGYCEGVFEECAFQRRGIWDVFVDLGIRLGKVQKRDVLTLLTR